TQSDSRVCLPAVHGRWPNDCVQRGQLRCERPWRWGPHRDGQETASLAHAIQPRQEEVVGYDRLTPHIRCVVGIDVANIPRSSGSWRRPVAPYIVKSTPIPATAAAYAQLLAWLTAWAEGEPARQLISLESTDGLWESLYAALTRAGYAVPL